MKFLAYSSRGESVRISYDERDESAGILGAVTTSELPIGESETREGIADSAYAFLGRDPTGSIYITDSQNRLLDILINEKYHKDLEAQATWHFMAWTLLFFCVVCFLGTLVIGLHWGGLGLFFFIASLFIACVRLGIQNEGESAVLCTIILLLILVLVPGIRAVRERDQRPPSVEQPHAPEPAAGPISDGESAPPGQ